MSSLIKAVLVLKLREIPPTLHITRPNPAIEWAAMRLPAQALADVAYTLLMWIKQLSPEDRQRMLQPTKQK